MVFQLLHSITTSEFQTQTLKHVFIFDEAKLNAFLKIKSLKTLGYFSYKIVNLLLNLVNYLWL